ncbi:MAG TPA: DUF4395 domain-containing protein [Acidimicrobiia bacterium]|nr:DUF4395 domain-containing protein [Acidimicrobiia bacterium]
MATITAPARRPLSAFPETVNEVSARLVAAGVVAMAVGILAFDQWWILVPLVYGFVARVAAGPRFSPLGLLVTKVVTPNLAVEPRIVPGPPKQFAQGIGALFSVTVAVLHLGGASDAAAVVLGMLAFAATLESAFGYCLGCKVFSLLMRVGVIPESVCEACNDLTLRRPEPATP